MMSFFLAASLGLTGACSADHHEEQSAQPQAQTEAASQPADGSTATGVVAETMNAGNYTYVRVNTDDGEIWAAATRFNVAVGDTVVVPLQMPMQDFYSESLDRTFPVVYFTSQILLQGEESSAAMPAGHPPVTGAETSSQGTANLTAPIEPAAGGVTVARVWAETAGLAGTEVTVRGSVVKFNGGILGTNWIHLQDGTGSVEDGTHDITVTTDATASVGDVITVKGTLVTDKDFGAGYTYAVMIENAKLVAE